MLYLNQPLLVWGCPLCNLGSVMIHVIWSILASLLFVGFTTKIWFWERFFRRFGIFFYHAVTVPSVIHWWGSFVSVTGGANPNGLIHGSQNEGHSLAHPLVNQTMSILPVQASAAVTGPATNLNIGMDYWGAPTTSVVPSMCGKVPSGPITGGVAAGSRDSVQSQLWLQV